MKLKLDGGNACTIDKDYSLSIQINCDAGASRLSYSLDETSIVDDECSPVIIMNAPEGCPIFSMPALWRWGETFQYIVAVFFIFVGLLLLQFGGKYYMASIFTINSIGMMFLTLSVLFGIILPNSTPLELVWIMVGMSAGIGLGLGYGGYRWPKFGIFTIGLFSGSLFG